MKSKGYTKSSFNASNHKLLLENVWPEATFIQLLARYRSQVYEHYLPFTDTLQKEATAPGK